MSKIKPVAPAADKYIIGTLRGQRQVELRCRQEPRAGIAFAKAIAAGWILAAPAWNGAPASAVPRGDSFATSGSRGVR